MSKELQKVATLAEVSTATVRRALNGDSRVRSRTRIRIRDAARQVGYRVNPMARALRSGVKVNAGIVFAGVTEISTTILMRAYAPMVSRLAREMDRRGQNLMIGMMEAMVSPKAFEDRLPKMIGGGHADRLIVIGHMWPELANELRCMKVPTVVVDGPSCGLPVVCRDESGSAEILVDHLVSQGHRRIAFLNHQPTPRKNDFRDTLWPSGYLRAITRHQLVPVPGWELFEQIEESVERLLSMNEPPTALIAYDDVNAIRLRDELAKRGGGVPHEMSIAAMSDMGYSEMVSAGVTHVASPFEEMADAAANLVLSLNPSDEADNDGPTVVKLPGMLVEGTTVKAL